MPAVSESNHAYQVRPTKELCVERLQGARVGSSKGYIAVAGTILSIPHRKSRSTASLAPVCAPDGTETRNCFQDNSHCYASMDKKPLVPYSPDAHRSRLAQPPFPPPGKNVSSIVFDDGMHFCHKRRFMTTNIVSHTGESPNSRTNPAVIAADLRFRRQQQAK